MNYLRSAFLVGSLCLTCAAHAEFVAGSNPAQRPADAPKITADNKDAAWYQQALRGVSAPYPAALCFLQHQGHWFVPFTRAGMTGPYDIRHWHSSQQAAVAGEHPSRRPADAPMVLSVDKNPMWLKRAFFGIEPPAPNSVMAMLNSQGAWFTPFIRAGMTGPYDVRGWHFSS
ncbi:MAG: hypothetical protein RIT27_1541 [Pseudomonadota bacterium]